MKALYLSAALLLYSPLMILKAQASDIGDKIESPIIYGILYTIGDGMSGIAIVAFQTYIKN